MNFKLCLDYGCSPIWAIYEDGLATLDTEELYFSDALKEKIDSMNDLYHSLFINNAKEFAYIGADKPEIEAEIKRLNQEVAEGIRAELKEGDKLTEVSDFLTSDEAAIQAEIEKQKEKHTVNNNVRLRVMSSNFNFFPDKLEYGSDFSLEYDPFHFYLIQGAFLDGKYDFPVVIDKDIRLPKYLVPFSKRKRIKAEVKKDVALHFYQHDVSFASFLQHPENFLSEIKEFGGIVSPDPSLYTNMPLAVQLYNSFLNRAITFFLQKNKVNVIPNVRWGSRESFEFCFDGLVTRATYAISGHGCIQKKCEKELFKKGLETMLEKLTPRLVLVYGPMPKSVFEDFEKEWNFLHFEEWTHLIHSPEGQALVHHKKEE